MKIMWVQSKCDSFFNDFYFNKMYGITAAKINIVPCLQGSPVLFKEFIFDLEMSPAPGPHPKTPPPTPLLLISL